jgi:16S rRNA C967 or C1407 C5-methylase (RsmB/RsmF family)/NOL1/NOP2/fmu family ribosome biogenesis protein
MQVLLGEAFPEFESALQTPASVSIRLNIFKALPAVPQDPVPWSTAGYYLPKRPAFTLDPFFHAGAYYVQEASSMFIEQALRQHLLLDTSLQVLDLCAAPGGKSTLLASLLTQDSLLVANEVIKQRAAVLKENIQKWGYANVVVTQSDPEKFSTLDSFFDVLVVDAPCSGEGLFRKGEVAAGEWSPEHVQHCAARQQRILEDVWPALKDGGVLVYSTCTYNKQEDEEILEWLLNEYDAECLSVALDPAWQIEEVQGAAGAVGYKFFPHRAKGEGFFMGIVRKKSGGRVRKSKRINSPFVPLPSRQAEMIHSWLKEGHGLTKVLFGDFIQALPGGKIEAVAELARAVHIVSCGLEMGEIKKKNIIPLPALALSVFLNQAAFPQVALEYPDALRYLARQHFEVVLPDGDWILVTYKGIPLGWLKKIDSRFNNYYPIEWRIRMELPADAVAPNLVSSARSTEDRI